MSYPGTTKIFEQIADKIVTNSTAETSIIGPGVGSVVMQPADFVVGGSIELLVRGVYSAAAVAPTLQVKVIVGGVTLATATTPNLLALAVNQPFVSRMSMVCRARGASGSLVPNGEMSFGVAASYWASVGVDNAGAAMAVDLSAAAIPIDVTVKFGATNIANILKINQLRLLRL